MVFKANFNTKNSLKEIKPIRVQLNCSTVSCLHQRFSLEEARFLHFKGILAQDQGFTTYSQQKQNAAIIDDLQDKKTFYHLELEWVPNPTRLEGPGLKKSLN